MKRTYLNSFLLTWFPLKSEIGLTFHATAPAGVSFRNDNLLTEFRIFAACDRDADWRGVQGWVAEMDGAILGSDLDDVQEGIGLCESELVRYLAPAIHRHDAMLHPNACQIMEGLGRSNYTVTGEGDDES